MSINVSEPTTGLGLQMVSSIPARISRMDGDEGLFVVEDITGSPLALTGDEWLARLFFAAPGMYHAMGALADVLMNIRRRGGILDIADAEKLLGLIKDVNLAMEGATSAGSIRTH